MRHQGAFAVGLLLWLTACAPARVAPEAGRLDHRDADRFAAVFDAAAETPAADALQRGYLDPASPTLLAFAPEYIVDAATLAKSVADAPGKYRHAVHACLPMLRDMEDFIIDVQQRHTRLLPGAQPAEVALLLANGNTAGTVVDGRIVLGLETLCDGMSSPTGLRERLGGLVAHEWVHTQQAVPSEAERRDLLAWALREGVASTLAALALGEDASAADHDWAMAREADLWRQFQQDRDTMRAHWPAGGEPDATAIAAGTRWLWNSASADGRPADLGYWIGQRVAHAWFLRQGGTPDAVRRMLAMSSVDAFVAESGYAPVAPTPATPP